MWLKLGVIITACSLGILLGNYLMWAFPEHSWNYETNCAVSEANATMMVFSIFFMVGIGFVTSFFVSRKLEREEEKKDILE